MADYTFFICNKNFDEGRKLSAELVMDIHLASPDSGALLDAYPRKPNCYDNQLWEMVQSSQSTGSGGWFYFIKSKLNGLVIGIQGGSKSSGASLEMAAQKTPEDDSQLWEFSKVNINDPLGYEWYYTMSKLNGYVIGIQPGSKIDWTWLTVTSPNGSDYQLWMQQSP